MSAALIAVVVVVLIVLAGGGLLTTVALVAGVAYLRRVGVPRMPRWQRRLVASKVNKHLAAKAEDEAIASVVEAVGYETE